MHRLEPACKDTQKSLDKAGVYGAGLSGGGRMASSCLPPAAQNWPAGGNMAPPGMVWPGSSLSQPGTSWGASGIGPPITGVTGTWTQVAPPAGPTPGTSTAELPRNKPRVFNIHQKLKELYFEECRKGRANNLPAPLRNLKRGSRLLEKLVERENLNTLIVNLGPGNKGYSLSLRNHGKVPAALSSQAGRIQGSEEATPTTRWPYSDEELLRCIDREELPVTLADLIEAEHPNLFYQGCVIAEIRDSRLTHPLTTFETHHVLLKPTTQSILNDVNMLSTAHDLSAEERLSLESQIVQATAPPLCLDPNPAVGVMLNNLQAKKHRFSTAPFRRMARKFSQVTVNRKRKLDHFTANNTLQLYDFVTKKRAKASQGKQTKKSGEGVMPTPPPVPRDEPLALAVPSIEPDVFQHAKHYEKPKETKDCSASLVEEYILETERTQGTIYHIKLTILQRASNAEYLGELYVDKDYKEGEKNGSSCRFVLGTRAHANRYIQQFTEIFTEEGRKSVRITHIIPGQPGRVSFTQGMRERTGQLQAMQAAAAAAAAAARPATASQQVSGQVIVPKPVPTATIAKAPVANIQSVSHLTHLLKNAAVPPNVNVHQIPQQQPVAGLSNSAIQSILSGALSSAGIGADTALTNGPAPTGPTQTVASNPSANAPLHYQSVPTQAEAAQEIQALATSLMFSAERYEMKVANQANQPQVTSLVQTADTPSAPAPVTAAATPPSAQNPTIRGLLNATHPPANPKLVPRKTNVNARLLNQNLSAALTNNVSSSTLLVNNSQLRGTLSSFPNQLVTQATAQPGGFTIVTTQGNPALNSAPAQTYSLSGLTQLQGQTFTLTPNAGTFTVLQPSPNYSMPAVQSQTFQIPAGTTGHTFTITTPVVSVSGQFASQPQNSLTVNPSNQVFTVIPQTSQAGGKQTTKGYTIQANSPAFAKARAATQRRLSTAFQQVPNASELNKLLSERSDSRVLTERHIADKSDNVRLSQVLGDGKVGDATASSLGLSMPGLSALLAGTPSADNPIPGALGSGSSSLLERLTTPTAATFTSPPPAFPPQSPAPSPSQTITFQNSGAFGTSPSHAFNSVNLSSPLPSLTSPGLPSFASPSPKSQVFQAVSPTSSPLSSPPGTAPVSLNLQGLSLQSLAGLPSGLQVSIPISLSLPGQQGSAQGVLMTSLPVASTTNTTTTASAATMVLSNSSSGGSLLSLPVAQIMGSGSKNVNTRTQGSTSITIPQGTAQSIQLVSALQRPSSRSSANQIQGTKSMQPIAARSVSDQRPPIKMAASTAAGAQLINNAGNQIQMSMSPQQFQLFQKHGIQGLHLSAGCMTPQKNAISAAAIANKHRRRSSAADPNK